jgi:signal peptidase I
MGYVERPGNRPLHTHLPAMPTRHTTKLVSGGLGLIVLVCLWFAFAPVALGGSTTYVVTDGVSMEPRFHGGDLVAVRGQSSYRVGQIVAYHSKMFHTIVLHRIIARVGDRYVFKGDNNNFVDFEHPAASQLIGALWLHIPGAGSRLNSIRSPGLIAALAVIGTLLFVGGAFVQRRRRKRRQRRAEADSSLRLRNHLPRNLGEPTVSVLAIGLVALLPFVALALLAFTRPATAPVPSAIPYKQSGTLSYTANASPGPAYAGDRAVTGDPLFTHVVSTVELRFRYVFHAAATHSLKGSASLDATITSTSGWQTTLQLGHPTYFRGDRAMVAATLNLTSLLALLHRVESTTAVNGTYTLTLIPHVSTTGSVDARPLNTTFSPRIGFTLSELEMQPSAPKANSLGGGQPAASPFTPSESGSVTGRRYQPLFLSLQVGRLSVASARAIALGAIIVILCALVAAFAYVRRPRHGDESAADESARIRGRYGRLLVPVARVWQLPGVSVVDVADMDALVRIAEHYDRSILHETGEGCEAFWVTDESGQFRYAVGDWSGATDSADVANVDHAPPEGLASEVYADELALGSMAGEVAVTATQPAVEILVSEPAAESDWAAYDSSTHDAADAIVQEWRAGWDSADVRRTTRSPV